MFCSHPVIYEKDGVPVCHICGAVLAPTVQVDKNPSEGEKPSEGPKQAEKRTRKKKDE